MIRKMSDALRERGPDDEGVYVDPWISLAHRRLSIIDLSPRARQPMTNEDGSLWLIYNGEIYNFQEISRKLREKGHQFTSQTDSEVILHAYEQYGMDCLRMFNGMWAFALYDRNRKILSLARDEFGIKPLYYHFDGKKLIFASTIQGVLASGVASRPNEKSILRHLFYGLDPEGDETFFEEIRILPPGTSLRFELESQKLTLAPWVLSSSSEKSVSPPSDEELREAFFEAVRMRTVADVEIGSCLSGGIDSSAIVCALAREGAGRLKTFSYIARGSQADESKFIQEAARFAQASSFTTLIDEDVFLAEIGDFVRNIEEPTPTLSPYAQYRVMKLAKEHGIKVLLDGQGADELFAGYEQFFGYRFNEHLKRGRLSDLAREWAGYYRSFGRFYALKKAAFVHLPFFAQRAAWIRAFSDCMNKELLPDLRLKSVPAWRSNSLREALDHAMGPSGLGRLLLWEDKNSMRWGIEARVPFLDPSLVRMARSLPSERLIRDGYGKAAFRAAMRGTVPDPILDRRDKVGFEAETDELFRKPRIKELLGDVLLSRSFRERGYWDGKKVQKRLEAHWANEVNAGSAIWSWVHLELWMREFFR